jgi:hypothetical protein
MNGFADIEIPESRPALVPMRYYGRMRYTLKIGTGEDEFSRKVITNNRGERLVDITPRGPFTNINDDQDELPTRNRIEVRIVDVQQTIEDLLDLAYLCCISGLHAIYLQKIGVIKQDDYHKTNLENAIANGNKAVLKRENGKTESLEESLSRWIEETSKYQDYLGINIKNLPSEKLQREPLQQQFEVKYKTRRIEKLRQQGKNHAIVELGDSRVVTDPNGARYKIEAGAKIRGIISATYKLFYEEIDGLVTEFNGFTVANNLDVENLSIPLNENDRVVNVVTRSQSLLDRLFGDFF